MAQHLDNIDKFFYPRNTRFPEQFMGDVKALVGMATSEIIEQFSQVRVCSVFVTGTYSVIQAFSLSCYMLHVTFCFSELHVHLFHGSKYYISILNNLVISPVHCFQVPVEIRAGVFYQDFEKSNRRRDFEI